MTTAFNLMIIYYELDRTATEGLPASYEDVWRNAQRGGVYPTYGKDCYGQEVLPETGSKN